MRVTRWNGKRSIRVHVGKLYLGCRWRKPWAAFCIYNGRRHSWQLQTWLPRWSHWQEAVAAAPGEESPK